jgi:hypothetical protein
MAGKPEEQTREDKERLVGIVMASVLITFQIVASGAMVYAMLRIPGLLESVFKEHFAGILGPTMSVMTALVIVVIFRVAAGPIEFDTPFGFKFKGASGPVVLWVFTYLACVSGMVALWKVGK